jgi:dTDP-4-dehydrorhamnose reductase
MCQRTMYLMVTLKFHIKRTIETNPQGVYGESKLKGELAIQSSGCKYMIIRTAWVFSEYGNNFLKTMLASWALSAMS